MRNKDKSLTPFYIFIFAALISASALVIAAWITNKGAQPQPAASDPPNTQTQQAPPESAFDTSINPFLDNFSNPTTGYNTALWSCNNCQSGTISSEDGTLRLETGGVDLGLNISSKPSWPSSKVKYIQGDLMLTNDGEPWYETVDLSFNAILTSVFWQTGCLITTSGFL
jgi:hypothetical protein